MTLTTRRVRLAQKPQHAIEASDFIIDEIPLEEPQDGQLLLRPLYLSLDPYLLSFMRSWSGPQRDWAEGIISSRYIAQVLSSKAEGFSEGDLVIGDGHWQDLDVRSAKGLKLIAASSLSPSLHLGIIGAPGVTAWAGVTDVLRPEQGQTLVVSAASGPVGSTAGQLAKLAGARVVGIAGGEEKCRHVVEHFGFDACIDHRQPDFPAALAAALPNGADLHFEGVGAATLDPVLPLMNAFGRIALCGLMQHYQDTDPVSLGNFRCLLYSALQVRGFRLGDYGKQFKDATVILSGLVERGELRHSEVISEGLERAPAAYVAMTRGQGIGKHLVRLG
jgi:NADPH-dependent curcumin reductase CurA